LKKKKRYQRDPKNRRVNAGFLLFFNLFLADNKVRKEGQWSPAKQSSRCFCKFIGVCKKSKALF